MNATANRVYPSLTSPSLHPHNHLPSITTRLKKPSSVGSLAERTHGSSSSKAGHPSASMRHTVDPHVKEHGEWEGGFARRWIKWMHKEGIKHWTLPCVLLAATWIKWAIGLGSYSGMTLNLFLEAHITNLLSLGRNTPPMFGDYEAQRHWMEITIHLPFQQWYTYDLQYWGLDYPPLTAYISWLCGKVYANGQHTPNEPHSDHFIHSGSWIEPSWFALDASRGIETEGSKVYMRATVLVCDLLYVWAVIMFTRTIRSARSPRTQVRVSYHDLLVLNHKR